MVRLKGKIVVAFLLVATLFQANIAQASSFGNKISEQQMEIAPQVKHIQQTYQSGDVKQFVNVLDLNLSNTYTNLEVGIPNPINSLKTTSAMAKANSTIGHQVVGAVNASYFLGNGYPANLLAQDNEILNYGILGTGTESPTQYPIAFGISKEGKGIIDYYTTDLSFTVNGQKFPIDLINSERSTDKTVLYTPQYGATTKTNAWGLEIVVKNASQNMNSLHFGDQISGEVVDVTQYGVGGSSSIPADGFVLSIQNKTVAEQVKNAVSVGSPIEVSLAIDDKWKDAEFILAAGPLLVKDGKLNISMSTSSSFAKLNNPRTAVAIDATGDKVFLVTVDGRQSHSKGTSLTNLGNQLISMGAAAAINLDGGGSTTMVVREPGLQYPSLVNKPSDGSERRVSAILQIVNTAPKGKLKSFQINSNASIVLKNSSVELSVSKAYDEYLNPATIDSSAVKWTVQGDIGKINGTTFTATKSGEGKIIAEYQGIKREMAVTVNEVDSHVLLDSFDDATKWSAKTARAKATISNSTKQEPVREGSSSLKLTYDFTNTENGTTAAYAVANTPISIVGQPKNIGVWVYAEGGSHWLRGIIIDGTGKEHTVDFTAEGGLDWSGWKYVTASIPSGIATPLKFERIYVAQPNKSLQNKGKIYFDKLQAVYKDNYKEQLYTDVKSEFWAYGPIEKLNERGLIKGYINGTFKPNNSITRAEAATIIARALNVKATKTPDFSDVKSTHYAYDAIAAVSEKGIITGRSAGEFAPDGKLTRAEMAAIITRAYSLKGSKNISFKDVPEKHWAYSYVETLVANNLTSGYSDNTYRPNAQITRAEFATFLDRVISTKK